MEKTTLSTTLRPKFAKPEKPWPDFPLYWHPRGYWMKRYDGQELRYEADATKSYDRWLKDRDAMDAGRETTRPRKRYTIRDAINLYLTGQKQRLDENEIGDGQFVRCRAELEYHLPKAIGITTPLSGFRAKDPEDVGPARLFHKIRSKAIARGLSAARKHIVIVRAMLDNAEAKRLMMTPSYGDDFNPPSEDKITAERYRHISEHGERTWDVTEVRKMLTAAEAMRKERRGGKMKNRIRPNHHLYAQILLGLFACYASDDLSGLPEKVIDMKTGVLKWARAKNGRPTMCILPPVVLDAVRWSLAHRAPASTPAAERLLFRTIDGKPCNSNPRHVDETGMVIRLGRNDTIGQNLKRLLIRIGMKKPKTGFKSLRAVGRTLLVGGNIHEDIVAVIMGRKFRYAVDDYYIRGELRAEMTRAAEHIQSVLFPRTKTKSPSKRTQSRR